MIELNTRAGHAWKTRPIWYQNFSEQVSKDTELGSRYYQSTKATWHIKESKLLEQYGGKVSFRNRRTLKFYIFEDDKNASLFLLRWG